MNCNFTNNTATNGDGGAIEFDGTGTVTNCNFIGNNATYYGGAVCFWDNGEVTNCNLSVYRFDCVMVHEIVSNISQIFFNINIHHQLFKT